MVYWTSDDVVQVGEEKVSIPAENGLNYTVGQTSRRVNLFIPPSVKFLSGKDSYLQFDLKINQPDTLHTRLQLDPAGAGVLVQNIRIYDGSRGNLIEEINEYNQLVVLDSDYNSDESGRGLKALTQGATDYSHVTGGTLGTSKTDLNDLHTNPYFKAKTDATQAIPHKGADANNTVKCCLPLDKTGVFSGDIFPVMMTDGLFMEIDLMAAPRVINQVDAVARFRRTKLNPGFLNREPLIGGNGSIISASNASIPAFILKVDNRINAVPSNVPFCVGESIGFCKSTNSASVITFDAPLLVGQINASNNNIQVTITGGDAIAIDAAQDTLSDENNYVVFSKEITSKPVEAAKVTYTVSNVNFIAHQIMFDPSYEQRMLAKSRAGKFIEFDIYSYTNYKNSMLASERQATFLINAQNSKAKALLTIPTDQTVYTSAQMISNTGTYEVTSDSMDTTLCSNRPGLAGCCDFLSSYQFQMDGKLVPSRPVSTRKIATRKSIDAFHVFESEKMLANSHIEPKSFVKFMENFVIGRGFGGSNNGVMDLRGKDLSLILNYSETTAPTKNKTFNSFVYHVRRVRIRGGMAEVIV